MTKNIGEKPALRDGLVGHHPGSGAQLADDVRNAHQSGETCSSPGGRSPLSDHLPDPQQPAGAALHAAAQVRQVPRTQYRTHRHRVSGWWTSTSACRPHDAAERPRDDRRLPQGFVLQPRNLLERRAGFLHDRSQHRHQAYLPVDARRAADGGTSSGRTCKPRWTT